MLTSPQALDWNRLPHIGDRIIWTSEAYGHLRGRFASTSTSQSGVMSWYQLPFEDAQVEKFPQQGGIYIFTFTFYCLEFLEHKMILYLGEAGNLRNRLRQHLQTSQLTEAQLNQSKRTTPHEKRLWSLFTSFQNLVVNYCTLDIPQDERRVLERQMIGVLDPPFNWQHRARPRGQPLVGRPGAIPYTARPSRPAFSSQ